jgi:hypothetical protein
MATNSSLRWINHPNPYGLIHIHLQLHGAHVTTIIQLSGMPIASSNARAPQKTEYYLLARGLGTATQRSSLHLEAPSPSRRPSKSTRVIHVLHIMVA